MDKDLLTTLEIRPGATIDEVVAEVTKALLGKPGFNGVGKIEKDNKEGIIILLDRPLEPETAPNIPETIGGFALETKVVGVNRFAGDRGNSSGHSR